MAKVDLGPPSEEDYLLLGLQPYGGQSAAVVKATFRARAVELHPDTSAEDGKKFASLKDAYDRILAAIGTPIHDSGVAGTNERARYAEPEEEAGPEWDEQPPDWGEPAADTKSDSETLQWAARRSSSTGCAGSCSSRSSGRRPSSARSSAWDSPRSPDS